MITRETATVINAKSAQTTSRCPSVVCLKSTTIGPNRTLHNSGTRATETERPRILTLHRDSVHRRTQLTWRIWRRPARTTVRIRAKRHRIPLEVRIILIANGKAHAIEELDLSTRAPRRRNAAFGAGAVGVPGTGAIARTQLAGGWKHTGRTRRTYVFITPERNALMVLLPQSLGADMTGPTKVVRVSLHNELIPTVSFSIRELPSSQWSFTFRSVSGPPSGIPPMPSLVELEAEGRYLYQYTASNGAGAKDIIGHWALVLPPETAARLEHTGDGQSAPWGSAWLASRQPSWRQVEVPGSPNGAFARWSVRETSARVPPGGSLGGFRVQSDRMPGFTTAYFSVSVRDDENVLDVEELPKEVSDQLGLLSEFHLTRQTALTFGPIFRPDAPRAEMVANFRAGVGRLIEKQRLDPQSAFTKEVLQALQTPEPLPGQAVVIRSQPTNELEIEIMQALRISLRFQFPSGNP